MRLDELLRDGVRVDHLRERGRVAVGECVVADDSLDGDTEGRVERDGPFQDACRGGALLIGMDLRVSDSGVVVDDGVDVVVSQSPFAVRAFTATV